MLGIRHAHGPRAKEKELNKLNFPLWLLLAAQDAANRAEWCDRVVVNSKCAEVINKYYAVYICFGVQQMVRWVRFCLCVFVLLIFWQNDESDHGAVALPLTFIF